MILERLFETINLWPAYIGASFGGAILCVFVSSLSVHGQIGANDSGSLRLGRRLSILIIALAMLWSVAYANEKSWQPWPGDLMIRLGIDLWLIVVAVSASRQSTPEKSAGTSFN